MLILRNLLLVNVNGDMALQLCMTTALPSIKLEGHGEVDGIGQVKGLNREVDVCQCNVLLLLCALKLT
jgi:hypothetical protein